MTEKEQFCDKCMDEVGEWVQPVADFVADLASGNEPPDARKHDIGNFSQEIDLMLKKAIEDEREACAAIAAGYTSSEYYDDKEHAVADGIAEEIRARGESEA